jgi:hypothetical protein
VGQHFHAFRNRLAAAEKKITTTSLAAEDKFSMIIAILRLLIISLIMAVVLTIRLKKQIIIQRM